MSYQLMFQKAIELQQNGALNEAEQIYRQILETAPDNADVLNLLGLIAQSKGIHGEAVNYFYKAAESAPQHFPIFFNLGISLGALGKNVEATEAFLQVLKLKPDCKEAYFALGNIYWQQGDNQKAVEEFGKALRIDKDYLPALTNLAEINNDEEELEKLSVGNPEALFYLGRRAAKAENFAKAAEILQKADSLTTNDEIKSLLGESLCELNRKDEALRLFYQAYDLNSHNFAAVMNIADLEAEKQNVKEAEKFYKRALELDAGNLRAHANYADMLYHNKRVVEALEEYRQAVLIDPQTPEISYNLALILKDLEEYERALDLMFHAYYLSGEREDWSLNIAETLVLFNEKAPEKAKKICENWYKKMPENMVVKHLWSAVNHQECNNDAEYNRLLFDNFALSYEQTLKNIDYKVVDKIAELYAPLEGKILDLGCGTGLLAEKLKTADNTFVGVDISENMLNKAKDKNVYAELYRDDILNFLQKKRQDFTLITAADVFCYFADLKEIISNCFPVRLLFSAETETSAEKYEIQANGRYKHNPEYIRALLKDIGYDYVEATELVLRRENGRDVKGMLFMTAKKS